MDAPNLYEIPLALHEEGLDDYVCRLLGFEPVSEGTPGHALDLSAWEALVRRVEAAIRPVRIGLIGKYVNLPDAYLSVVEALRHGGYAHGAKIDLEWIQAEEVEGLLAAGRLKGLDGIVIPGGFGERGIEGKIAAATYARENEIPCLGLCLGLHVMVIDYARNVVGLAGANSREFDPAVATPGHRLYGRAARRRRLWWHHAAGLLSGQAGARVRGGPDLRDRAGLRTPPPPLRGQPEVPDPPRGRPGWCRRAARPTTAWSSSSSCRTTRSGSAPRPTQSSRAGPDNPHPLFAALVEAAWQRADGRAPRLLDIDGLATVS